MTDNLLFEHFATLATAPEGIARLRELILQLAVRGKLGTQDAGDEPASVLAKNIRKEKERLVNAGKIRNEKSLDPITETAIPYQIPKNCTWMRFGELGQVVGGGTPRTTNPAYYVTHGIPWLTPADLYRHKDKYVGRGKKDISEDGLKDSSAQLLPKGAVLFSSRAPIGYVAIASNSLSTNQGFKSCVPYVIEMSEYIYYFLVSAAKEIDAKASGTTFKEVSGQEVKHILFPLPPLAEQHRIVAKVDRLMALCDELEARQQQERAGCFKLGTASLAGLHNAESPEEFEAQWAQVCDAFDLILDCPENVAVLRQTILQLAVQGRLRTQNPKDEPADELFSRIKKEREQVVKGKPIVIRPLENPKLHTLPDHWIWVRLGDVLADIRYGTSEKSDPQFRGIPVIRIPNIGNGILNFNDMKYLQIKDEIDTHKIKNGDLLTIRSNGSRDLVGKCAVAKNIDRSVAFASYLIRLRPILVNSEFLALALSSQNVRDQFFLSAKTTTGVHNINTEELARTMLALPPLAEQHRIVAKVDALMALCDALESRLKERAGVQGRLAGAVVKQVAGE